MDDHTPRTPRDVSAYVTTHSAIPRMGMSIPMPADTKPPAPPAGLPSGRSEQPHEPQ